MNLQFIFVHGLSGWGSYDKVNKYLPYWGTFKGNLIQFLNKKGYKSYAASVAPEGSTWDRACELYAQLTGTRVDYGKAHSERCRHERFGRDFSSEPLIPDWESDKKLVLLGHSFGGATIRLFAELLANGSEEERAAAAENELSGLFKGGLADKIHAVITLAAPTNGTTAYDLHEDPSFDPSTVKVSKRDERMGNMFSSRKHAEPDGRIPEDYAAFDMHIDNALELNSSITTLPNVYYFAVPCSTTEPAPDGSQHPIRKIMEGMFRRSSAQMGCYTRHRRIWTKSALHRASGISARYTGKTICLCRVE